MIPRNSYYNKIENAFKFLPIVVLTGARQVGKTTLMDNYYYDKKHIELNGQNSDVAKLFAKYSEIENYLKINLNKNIDGYLLIDEFQFIPNISTMMKLLVDSNQKLKIIVTGSSSLDIMQNVKESLAGRVRIINVYSLSFDEYIKFYDNTLYEEYLKYDINTSDVVVNNEINILLRSFLLYGGMPRIALSNKEKDKQELLHDIYQTYLMRDVKSYVRNEDTVGFNKLLRIVSAQISNIVNVNELSSSTNLSYKKTLEYLYLLEQMFIIKTVEPFHTNTKKSVTKMKKIYFYDTGMRNVIYNSFNDIDIRIDNGAIFENYVYLELLKQTNSSATINFFRTRDGAEVDFIINDMMKKTSFEVKYKKINKPVFFKILNTLNKAEDIENSYVINLTLNTHYKQIKFIQSYLIAKIFEQSSE